MYLLKEEFLTLLLPINQENGVSHLKLMEYYNDHQFFVLNGQKGLFQELAIFTFKNYVLYAACMMYKCGHGLNLFSLVRIQLY